MKILIIIFILFNLLTFLIFGFDKLLARSKKKRISENTLFTLALIGGSVGAVFAQKVFRHKSTKYPKLFWAILIFQFLIYEVFWFYGGHFQDTLILLKKEFIADIFF